MTTTRGALELAETGAGIAYVRFVVEASKVAPRYWQKETLNLPGVSVELCLKDEFCLYPDSSPSLRES